MRRRLTWVFAAVVITAGLPACSAPGEPAAAVPTSINGIGNPADTASPVDTSTPTPSAPEEPLTPTVTATATPTDPGATALATCLNGNWSAPVAREFGALGLSDRSRGVVRSGSGVLQLTFGRDKSFTFTYANVQLNLAAGQSTVTGPVTGTWSLAGNTLRTVLMQTSTKVTFSFGPLTVGAPDSVARVVRTLPPAEVKVTCDAAQLKMVLPSSEGGGTVTFDRV